MKISEKEMQDWRETVVEIIRLAKNYYADMPATDIFEFYNNVRAIPYRRDAKDIEVLVRPRILLDSKNPMDCKKKSILIAAAAEKNKTPWRLAVVGERPAIGDLKVHHIYPEIKFGRDWIPFDATFPEKSMLGKKLYRADIRYVFYPDEE